jgi:phosphate transport system substrate-binding protein
MVVTTLRFLAGSLALGVVALVAACAGGGDGSQGATSLTGAGASFPNPIYARWFDEYHRATGVQINYQSIGSGGGVRQFSQGTVDFGATDGPMTDDQIAAIDGNVLHIPTVIGAVVLTYNLPSLGENQLSLDGETISDIFLGRITKWNDRRIAALNSRVALPDEDILVVHRSDGSGTTFVFTDFLSKVSPAWAQDVGADKSVNWPVGLGGKGNEGVTQQVKQLEFTIGYVELIYALSNDLAYATIINRAGNGVVPTLATASAAAGSAEFTPDTDFRVSITDAAGEQAYPITSFTWLLVRQDDDNKDRALAIRAFLEWMTGEEAQAIVQELRYAPLPSEVVSLVEARIEGLTSSGQLLE